MHAFFSIHFRSGAENVGHVGAIFNHRPPLPEVTGDIGAASD